jgi:putative Holliday junction resolvase
MPENDERVRPGPGPGLTPLTVLAFDFGLRSIGVAVGQNVTRTASPAGTLLARSGAPRWEEVDALVTRWRPSRLLVGLPLNMDGTESEMSGRARAFAVALGARYGIPFDLVDERLTSVEARGLSDDGAERHAIAARLIAESWLSGGT